MCVIALGRMCLMRKKKKDYVDCEECKELHPFLNQNFPFQQINSLEAEGQC